MTSIKMNNKEINIQTTSIQKTRPNSWSKNENQFWYQIYTSRFLKSLICQYNITGKYDFAPGLTVLVT